MRNNNFFTLIIGLSTALFLIGLMIFVVKPLPVVQISYQTKECIQVLPQGSCDELPSKYEREWVR